MSEQISSEQISDKLNENTPNQEIKNTSRSAVYDNEKIAEEIFLILKTPSSKVLKLRAVNNMQALSNRSNIHFRW